MEITKEKPVTYPQGTTLSRHYPMWLYQCNACDCYASFSGMVVQGGPPGIIHKGCGMFFPVEPFEITEYKPFDDDQEMSERLNSNTMEIS